MNFYFTLQFKRIYRHIDEFGVIPLIGFALLLALFSWVSEAIFKNISQASYYYIGIGLLLTLKLGNIKRTVFLQKCFPLETFWKVRMLENTLFVLPFSGFLCYKQAFIEIIIIHVGAIMLSFFNNLGIRSITIPTPFGKNPFEFVIGFRNTFWLFPVLYILTYIAVFVDNYNLGVFSLIAVFVCCMSFYSKQEPLYYIWIHSMTSKEFLNHKIKTAILFSSFLVLPIVIGLSLFFSLERLQITLLFTVLGYSFILLTIIGKYSNYPSQVHLFQTLAMLVCLLFPPLLILIIPYFYKRSIKKLNSILVC
ncbi:ABC transporter permease [Kordia antarctica]|uniref:ABC transporter permease n=1 Tax=Kordia antarctica TaxID=1218801 RepID=UPI0013571ECB|nr:ABC transporter permease [Kordia antarctica]